MTVGSLISNIGLLVVLLGSLFILKYTGALDFILHAFGWMRAVFDWLMSNKIFRVMTFIFLIGISSAVVSFILSLNYACDTGDNLRTQKVGIMGGIAMLMVSASGDINATDPSYDDFIGNWTVEAETYDDTSYQSIMKVNCIGQDPRLTLFGRIDFLDYRYWILTLLLVAAISLFIRLRGR